MDSNLTRLHALPAQFAARPVRQLKTEKPVWIFGAGQFGRDVCAVLQAQGFDVQGFIQTKSGTQQAMGVQILDWQQWATVRFDVQLVIGAFNRGMPLDELGGIARAAGASDIFMPWDIYNQFEAQMGWRYWLGVPQTILRGLQAIDRAFQLLADETSRRCLVDICAFRLGLNPEYASFQHPDNQYFNALTLDPLGRSDVQFSDGGAYSGDTFMEFCSLANVTDAYLFEPDGDNFRALVRNVSPSQCKIMCLPLALADSYAMLNFEAGAGEGAALSDAGTVHVTAVALDDVLCGRNVNFIKLHVEGAEAQALNGARSLIRRSRPIWQSLRITARKPFGHFLNWWRLCARNMISTFASITSIVLTLCFTQSSVDSSANYS